MEKTATQTQRKPRQCPPLLTPNVPWLLFPHGDTLKDQTFCCFNNQSFRKSIPELRNREICGSWHGWLILADNDYFLFLFNLVTFETIPLPQQDTHPDYQIKYCILSSPPSDTTSKILLFMTDNQTILFCRPGDKRWTETNYKKDLEILSGYKDARIFNVGVCSGKVYACGGRSELLLIEFGESNQLVLRPLGIKFVPQKIANSICYGSFFIESCGELYGVQIAFRTERHEEIRGIEVLRLDSSRMVWEEERSLKGRAFFLGDDCSTSCPAMPEAGIQEGSIYFTMSKDPRLYCFNLEDQSISDSLPCYNLLTPWASPVWVLPNIRLIDTQPEEKDRVNAEPKERTRDTKVQEKEVNAWRGSGEAEQSLLLQLPLEIVELVYKHLNAIDYIHFRSSCKILRSAAIPLKWRTRLIGSEMQTSTPWFAYFMIDGTTLNVIDPRYNDSYVLKTSEKFGDKQVFCCKDGFFIMSHDIDKGIYALNPFTQAIYTILEMPSYYYMYPYCFSFSCWSPDEDFVFVIILRRLIDEILVLYLRDGEGWNYITIKDKPNFLPSPSSPIFFNGAFYCLSQQGGIAVIRFEGDNCVWEVLTKLEKPCKSIQNCFLVECDGELLSVFVGKFSKWVKVFRLNFAAMAWVRVQDLAKYTLFVSKASSFSTIATAPGMENKIYFPRLSCVTQNMRQQSVKVILLLSAPSHLGFSTLCPSKAIQICHDLV
ncbi:Domain unknown function DUF295 [Dillenia turbinata]|uniref:F-box domain-containing protein n=1 Tax=Dillenia turbinata TaxID=194707 RepID=A0AAN8W6K7_9MAGN